MKSHGLGYVVVDPDGPLELCSDPDQSTRILLHGNVATVFAKREAARRAIRRTLRYAETHEFNWSRSHRIYRLTPMTGGGR